MAFPHCPGAKTGAHFFSHYFAARNQLRYYTGRGRFSRELHAVFYKRKDHQQPLVCTAGTLPSVVVMCTHQSYETRPFPGWRLGPSCFPGQGEGMAAQLTSPCRDRIPNCGITSKHTGFDFLEHRFYFYGIGKDLTPYLISKFFN